MLLSQRLDDSSLKVILEAIEIIDGHAAQMFPFEPVESFLDETRATELSAILGVCADSVNKYRKKGMTVDEADRASCAIGMHPSLIWDDWTYTLPLPDSILDKVEDFLADNKLCGKCGEWKERADYHKRAAAKDGLARFCRPCMKSYDRSRERPERRKQASR